MRHAGWGGLLLAAMAAGSPAGAQVTVPAAASEPAASTATPGPAASAAVATLAAAPSAEIGRRTYTSFCTRCHGINLVVTGSAYFDLRSFPATDKARFLRSVSKGLRAMPAWETTLKPEQMESLWLYIGAVNGWAPPTAAPPQ